MTRDSDNADDGAHSLREKLQSPPVKLAIVLAVLSILLLSTALIVAADSLTLTQTETITTGSDGTFDVKYSPGGDYMAIGARGNLYLYDANGSQLDSVSTTNQVASVAWGPNGKYIAILDTDDTGSTASQVVYNTSGDTLGQEASFDVSGETEPFARTVDFSPDGEHLLRHEGNLLIVTNTGNWTTHDSEVLSYDIQSVAWDPSDEYIAAQNAGNLTLLDTEKPINVQHRIENDLSRFRIDFSRNGDYLSAIDTYRLYVYNTNDWTEAANISIGSGNGVFGNSFSRSGDYLAVSTQEDGSVIVYNTTTWSQEDSIGISDSGDLGWSANDSQLAVTTTTTDVNVYDTNITFSTPTDPTDTDEDLRLNVPKHLEHDESGYYEVLYNDSGTWTDVTNDSNTSITLSNPNAATFYPSNHTVVASGNTSINEAVTVTADYGTLTANSTLVVAGTTIENLAILPDPWIKTEASVGDGMMLWLIGAALVAIVGARAAGPTAGVGAYVMVMAAGWISTPVSNGVMIVAMTAAIFLGLNVALNVDTSVRGT